VKHRLSQYWPWCRCFNRSGAPGTLYFRWFGGRFTASHAPVSRPRPRTRWIVGLRRALDDLDAVGEETRRLRRLYLGRVVNGFRQLLAHWQQHKRAQHGANTSERNTHTRTRSTRSATQVPNTSELPTSQPKSLYEHRMDNEACLMLNHSLAYLILNRRAHLARASCLCHAYQFPSTASCHTITVTHRHTRDEHAVCGGTLVSNVVHHVIPLVLHFVVVHYNCSLN
jgi:hypothetical protein